MKTKLGCNISFDDVNDKVAITLVEKLASSRKLGTFIQALIKDFTENKELYKRGNDLLNERGIECSVKNYVQTIRDEFLEVKKKNDKIYDMCVSIETAYKYGSSVGMEQRINNLMMADLLVARDIKILAENGLKINVGVFAEDAIKNKDEIVDSALALFVEKMSRIGLTDKLQINEVSSGDEKYVIDNNEMGGENKGAEVGEDDKADEDVLDSRPIEDEVLGKLGDDEKVPDGSDVLGFFGMLD